MPDEINKPTYQSESQKITECYLHEHHRQISRIPYGVEPYDPDPLWEIEKQLAGLRTKLDQIATLIQAPSEGGYLLINRVWRKGETREENNPDKH